MVRSPTQSFRPHSRQLVPSGCKSGGPMTLQIQSHPLTGGPMLLQIRWSLQAANPACQVVPSSCKLALRCRRRPLQASPVSTQPNRPPTATQLPSNWPRTRAGPVQPPPNRPPTAPQPPSNWLRTRKYQDRSSDLRRCRRGGTTRARPVSEGPVAPRAAHCHGRAPSPSRL